MVILDSVNLKEHKAPLTSAIMDHVFFLLKDCPGFFIFVLLFFSPKFIEKSCIFGRRNISSCREEREPQLTLASTERKTMSER